MRGPHRRIQINSNDHASICRSRTWFFSARPNAHASKVNVDAINPTRLWKTRVILFFFRNLYMIAIPDRLSMTNRLIRNNAQAEWYEGVRPPRIKIPSGNFLYIIRLAVKNATLDATIIVFLCILHLWLNANISVPAVVAIAHVEAAIVWYRNSECSEGTVRNLCVDRLWGLCVCEEEEKTYYYDIPKEHPDSIGSLRWWRRISFLPFFYVFYVDRKFSLEFLVNLIDSVE